MEAERPPGEVGWHGGRVAGEVSCEGGDAAGRVIVSSPPVDEGEGSPWGGGDVAGALVGTGGAPEPGSGAGECEESSSDQRGR